MCISAFSCNEIIREDVVDLFGKSIQTLSIDENHFLLKTKMTKTESIYFTFQFIKFITIIKPQSLVNEVKDILQNTIERYEG